MDYYIITDKNKEFKVEKELSDFVEKLGKENVKLKDMYRKTCKHLFEIGNDELARYFQAQIGYCPNWVPMDDKIEKEEDKNE